MNAQNNDKFRVVSGGRERVLCTIYYAAFAKQPGGYAMTLARPELRCSVCKASHKGAQS